MKKQLLFLILSFIPALIFAQDRSPYQVYDTKAGKIITVAELVGQMKNVDVLVFGEEHNDSVGHRLEAQIFQQMLATYPRTALSMEMFATDVQPVIDEYLSGLISEKNFNKEARVWNNYADYKPLIALAQTNKTTVLGANVATRYSNAVSMQGLQALAKFPASSKSFLPPLPIDTATGRYHEKFIETLGGHDMGSMKIYQTQNLWDAAMAWTIAKYKKQNPKGKLMQINGRFHSDERLGLIAQLQKYAPKLKIATISCFSVADFNGGDWSPYTKLGDYIIVTAASQKK
jgi:uncharacterized iron-regulated protein